MDTEPRENSDLLAVYKKDGSSVTITDRRIDEAELKGPPDGGMRAYLVVIGSFLTNGLLFGVINSYGEMYKDIKQQLDLENVQYSDSRASLVGSLAMGTTFFLSPLSGALTGLLGIRAAAVLGGTIACIGLLASSFVIKHVDLLCFTYSITYGLGASLAYTPSLAILGHYFKKYLGLVNGIVTIGSPIFTVIITSALPHMLKNYGLEWTFRVFAILTFGVALCGLLFKPIPLVVLKKPLKEDGIKALIKSVVNIDIWRNKQYTLWALSMPVALFGYFVPYVHLKTFITDNFKDSNSSLPLQCIVFTSALGRLLFGYLSDVPRIDRIFLQQLSFYVIGTLTILLPFVPNFPLVVVVSLGMGIFDGGFIALIGPIAFELCEGSGVAQAIGCMLGLASIPISVGPPIAGYIYRLLQSYTVAFVLAGISPIVGASIMFAIRFHKRNRNAGRNANGHVATVEVGSVEIGKPIH